MSNFFASFLKRLVPINHYKKNALTITNKNQYTPEKNIVDYIKFAFYLVVLNHYGEYLSSLLLEL